MPTGGYSPVGDPTFSWLQNTPAYCTAGKYDTTIRTYMVELYLNKLQDLAPIWRCAARAPSAQCLSTAIL